MRTVLNAIFAAKRNYATLPLFKFMRDETLSPRARLAFYPCMAPFILSFADLNKYVMRDAASTDPLQKVVNAHTFEDDHHWPWYLEDFAKLGFDERSSKIEALWFFYSDETKVNRMLSARLAHLLYDATPAERLIIIEAIEETGNVLFSLTAKLAHRIEAEEGLTLRYLGDFHFNLETGHTMGGADDHRTLAEIDLTDGERARCLSLVRLVFTYFEEWTNELLAYAVGESASETEEKTFIFESSSRPMLRQIG
jgi:hypothetical protein